LKISLTRSLTVSAALVVFYALRLQVRPESQSGARLIIVTAFALTGFLLSSCVIIARPKTNWQWPNIFLLNIMLTVLTACLAVTLSVPLPAWLRAM